MRTRSDSSKCKTCQVRSYRDDIVHNKTIIHFTLKGIYTSHITLTQQLFLQLIWLVKGVRNIDIYEYQNIMYCVTVIVTLQKTFLLWWNPWPPDNSFVIFTHLCHSLQHTVNWDRSSEHISLVWTQKTHSCETICHLDYSI